MAKIYTVTYLGKQGKRDEEHLPVPGIYPPFEVGVPRTFDADTLAACGVAPEGAEAFIVGEHGFVTLFNANRPKEHALFAVTTSDPTTKKVVENLKQRRKSATPPTTSAPPDATADVSPSTAQ